MAYIPAQDYSDEFRDSMYKFSNWMLQYKELQRREQQTQQEIQTGNLRQAALRLQNEQMGLQLGEWKDTKNLRMQALGAETQKSVAEASRAGSMAEIAGKDASRYDILAAQQDELHKVAMDTQKQQLVSLGINSQEAQKRLNLFDTQSKAQMEQLQAQTAEAKARVNALESGVKNAATDQEWQNFGRAIELMQGRSPAEQQALRENIPVVAPDLAPFIKAMPQNVTDPKRTAEEMIDNMIAYTGKDAEMTKTAGLLAALKVTGGRGVPVMKQQFMTDPKTGQQIPLGVEHGYDVTELAGRLANAISARNAATNQQPPRPIGAPPSVLETEFDQPTPGPTTRPAALGGSTAPVQPNKSGIDMNILPPELAPIAIHSQKYPRESSMLFQDSAMNRKDKGFQEYFRDVPKVVGSSDELLQPGGEVPKLQQQGFVGLARTNSPDSGGLGFNVQKPLLRDSTDQDVFQQLIKYDPKATGQQHTMYMGLMRQLAVAKNEGDNAKAKDLLTRFFKATGPNFLTPLQFNSVSELEQRMGW